MKNKQYVHGDHWKAIQTSEVDFAEILARAVNTEKNNKIYRGVGPYASLIGFKTPIRILTLIREREKDSMVWSAYPFLQINNPIEIAIDEIDVWPNKVEAIITGSTPRGTILSFFDTFYFMNKDKYQMKKSYIFHIAGLAYTFKKRDQGMLEFVPDEGPMKGQKISTHGMTGYQFGDVYTDDFIFHNPFRGFGKIHRLFRSKFYEFSFYLNAMEDDVPPIFFPIFVKTDLLGDFKPQPDIDIDGTGWLQGYLDGSLGS